MQIDEALGTKQAIDRVFARRVSAHQPFERRRLVMTEVIDVHPGMGVQRPLDQIDDGFERRALVGIVKRPP